MTILTSSELSVRASSAVPSWRGEIREAIRDMGELCRRLGLSAELGGRAAAGEFSVFVPPSYLARIQPGEAADPLLRQVLPVAEETVRVEGFVADPVGDGVAMLRPGVLQKYAGRALLITTGACAVHCRYCFRRHFPYDEAPHGVAEWERALASIAADDSIREVILSGGDPFMLSDDQLEKLVEKITAIPHIRRLRVHTRLPVMIPSRVTEQLLVWLTGSRLASVMVIHANHAQELDGHVAESLERLQQAGVMLLNQAVLLRGVNDTVDAQVALSERLIEVGVAPYYLHQLDRVAGAAHFEVPVAEGRRIVNEMRVRLPGYAVPRYVQEEPGELNKVVLA